MDLELRGKVALITGGAAGIGAAIARAFVAEGARVAIVDRNTEAGETLRAAIGTSALFVPAELADEADCQRAVATCLERFGALDVLVNNAGANDGVGLESSPGEFQQSLQRNLFHYFAMTHFAAASLKRSRGCIVNISSKVSVTGQGHTSGYAAAKGAVNALTREWAAALAPCGVRVNAVLPAECDTPQYQRWFAAQPEPSAARGAIENLVPLGARLTTPEEIAAAVVFLASPRSSHTTGQLLCIDGGYTHLDRALTQSRHVWG
jgi:L-fucose dehydrogenase